MRDLAADLKLCEEAALTFDSLVKQQHFAVDALHGWPEAIKRAMEAEAALKLVQQVGKGPKGYHDVDEFYKD